MNFNFKVAVLIGFAGSLFLYSNCGKMNSAIDQPSRISTLSSVTPEGEPAAQTPVTNNPPVTNPPATNPPTTPPVVTPPPKATGFGTTDPNCMHNTNYDACLFWKNPVAQRKAPYSEILKIGTDLHQDQTYGVNLVNRLSLNSLTSKTIRVSASHGTTPALENGKLRHPYSNDANNAWTAQLMAYFWLTTMETELVKRVGNFFAADKNIVVDAFGTTDPSMKGNAYFSKSMNKIALGYALSESKGIAHEMALSSEVYIHEMGHANLIHATTSNLTLDLKTRCVVTTNSDTKTAVRDCNKIYSTDSLKFKICPDQNGCPGAINEGQADFHVFLMFPANPAVGETVVNKLDGMSGRISRNPILTKNMTASNVYSNFNYTLLAGTAGAKSFQGEIHDLGAFYASILYEIYTDPGMNKNHFEKMFNEHLKMITTTSDFKTALADFKTLALGMKSQFGGVNYTTLITTIFNRRGIN